MPVQHMEYTSHVMKHTLSGVGVLDKAVAVVTELERGPLTLAELVEACGTTRSTTYRLAVALEAHGLVRRTDDGRFDLGSRWSSVGHLATQRFPLEHVARPILEQLRDITQESVQLYVIEGDIRRCLVSVDSPHELRTIVDTGARLPLDRGSAGRVLSSEPTGPDGWIETVGDRQSGVASVSAPIVDAAGHIVAAIGISGPIDRLGKHPGRRPGHDVVAAARDIAAAISTGAPVR